MFIRRNLATVLVRVARQYPVVTVTGPRQSGKTTLCRHVFRRKPYVNLERIDERTFASSDPRGFLTEYADGAVLDEVQHAPDLLSYLQADVDDDPRAGRWILTGSEHFGLSGSVAQTLAGRTGILHMLPLAVDELRRFPNPPADLFSTLVAGGFPRIHDQGIPSDRWLGDYVETYLQRDVRSLLSVGDLEAFTTFMRLLAGRTAQELNLSSLGSDAGVSHNTARSWLSVLEASFLVFRIPAWARSQRKRLVKTPKLHWMDTGLACHLLGIRAPEHLKTHPLRGSIFETFVAGEIYKAHASRGLSPRLFHLRETRGVEIDLLVDRGLDLRGVECKSGATVASDALDGLDKLEEAIGSSSEVGRGVLVYGGKKRQRRSKADVVPWHALSRADWFG
jgi:predicted AAA+ superfamily ATPase